MKMSETDVAAHVVDYLERDQWEVYQEVQPKGAGRVADIVATRASIVRIVEVKTSYTAAVVGQAERWRGWAHLVSIAVPHAGRSAPGRAVLDRYIRSAGIGRLSVLKLTGATELVRAALVRNVPHLEKLRSRLTEEQRAFGAKAGTSSGRRWTPFQETLRDLRRIVKEEPGIAAADAMRKLRHHYSSDAAARSALVRWVRDGVVDGLRVEGRPLAFFEVDEAEE